jgi:hypothetical protein
MAKGILAVEPLSRNDIAILAQLFEISFDYYINNHSTHSPFFNDYLKHLRTLVGLGFTAVLVDRSLLCIYEHYLERFMGQKEGDFRERKHAKTLIAQSVAEMVATSTISFSALQFPRYYDEFSTALHYTVAKIPELFGEKKKVQYILARLAVK